MIPSVMIHWGSTDQVHSGTGLAQEDLAITDGTSITEIAVGQSGYSSLYFVLNGVSD